MSSTSSAATTPTAYVLGDVCEENPENKPAGSDADIVFHHHHQADGTDKVDLLWRGHPGGIVMVDADHWDKGGIEALVNQAWPMTILRKEITPQWGSCYLVSRSDWAAGSTLRKSSDDPQTHLPECPCDICRARRRGEG